MRPRSAPRRLLRWARSAVTWVALLVIVVPSDGFAHLGGIIVRPTFFTPPAGITMIDGVVTVSWNDPDEDPTGILHFYVTPNSLPPTGYLSTTFFEEAIKIGEFPVSDPVDGFDWDTIDFSPGVYSLYAVSVDPPLCDTVTTSATTMVLRDPAGAEVSPLAGTWISPDSSFIGSIAGKTTLRLAAMSATKPSVTLRVGRIEPIVEGPPDADCSAVGVFKQKATIVTALEGEPDPNGGSDRWTFSTLWDSDSMLPGLHVFQAEFTNAEGQSYTLFSPVEVPIAGSIPTNVEPDAAPDEGPESSDDNTSRPDAAGSETQGAADEGSTLITVPVAQPDACAGSSGAPGPPPWPVLGVLIFIFIAWARSRRLRDDGV